jgi:hypothetical protein
VLSLVIAVPELRELFQFGAPLAAALAPAPPATALWADAVKGMRLQGAAVRPSQC